VQAPRCGSSLPQRALLFPTAASWARPFAAAAAAGGNPKVFFDCSVGGKPVGRITFELFNDVVPKVCSSPVRPSDFRARLPLAASRDMQCDVTIPQQSLIFSRMRRSAALCR
jgi:hypothetical protein